ncbi:PF04028 domain protein [Leptospira inadai serovar Lyme str. 10]|uniref:PF04028 domain protein n=2 Tax=Leptospira inadai serovar Lyme TaxID=293084 RepID=V6HMC7_9LEPT|nr:lysophospholipid acyltransferase family protein [Leptospira inadai]EQA38045.1 PF04028 domain protein [Leptospira inadai serovar Lyme str. 10]PNV75020.1 DUF374 domain-containing protein [Leptospira inadai serovar Lyme]
MKIRLEAWLSILFLRIIYLTIRWKEIKIPKTTEDLFRKKDSFLLALWHNQIPYAIDLTSSYLVKKRGMRIVPLASRSEDGEMISIVLEHFGIESRRGSSRRGGAAGLRALVKEAMDGGISLITPDGPTGPVYELKPGIIQLASLTGYPVIAFSADYDRFWKVNSWDRTKVPKPFSTATFTFTEPFVVPKLKGEKQLDEWRKKLENLMLENCGITSLEAENIRAEVRKQKK